MALRKFEAVLSDGYLYEFEAENFHVAEGVVRAYGKDGEVFAAPVGQIVSIVHESVKVSLR
jgi:hypothetical protein